MKTLVGRESLWCNFKMDVKSIDTKHLAVPMMQTKNTYSRENQNIFKILNYMLPVNILKLGGRKRGLSANHEARYTVHVRARIPDPIIRALFD